MKVPSAYAKVVFTTTMLLSLAVGRVRAFSVLSPTSRRAWTKGMRRTTTTRTTSRTTTTTRATPEDSSSSTPPPEEWTTNRVRSTFVEFFRSRDHTFVASSACAPLQDPTLLFTNAGMNQFKPIFLGQADPRSRLATLSRATNSQKCIRAGGKHNDLEDVGRDTYHHTFFEMLGSWSFGDYFKREAVDYAWELLTRVYRLPPDRLYATYFEGNEAVPMDTEARDYWLQYLPPQRVLACPAADNFWEVRIFLNIFCVWVWFLFLLFLSFLTKYSLHHFIFKDGRHGTLWALQ